MLEAIIKKHVVSPKAKNDLPLLHEDDYSTSPTIVQVLSDILFKKRTMQDQ